MYNKKLVFAAACTGMLLFGIVFLSLGTVLTFIRETYNLDETAAGTLTAILPLGILAGTLVFGPLVDRYGYKVILVISSLFISAAFEMIAFSDSFFLLQTAFLLIGFGGGAINGATNALVADISSEGKGANLSFLGVFFGIGAMGMPALIGALTGTVSYAAIVSFIGYFVILPVLFFVIIKFPVPKLAQGFPIKEIPKLFNITLLLLGFLLFFESAMEGITNNWTTSFLEKGAGFDSRTALFGLTVLNAGLLAARLILGFLLKKVQPHFVLFTCLILILTGAAILLIAENTIIIYAAIALLGIGFAPGFPVVLGYVGELYPDFSGTAFSFVITIGLIGNITVNWLLGIIAQQFGISKFPLVLIVSAVLMMILLSTVLKEYQTKIKYNRSKYAG